MPNGTGHVGDPVEPCPTDEGTLLVIVQDEETKAGLTGFSVEAKGKAEPAAKTPAKKSAAAPGCRWPSSGQPRSDAPPAAIRRSDAV